MAIKFWIADEKTHYEITLNMRSKIDQSIRIQKKETGTLSEIDADKARPQIEKIHTQMRDEVIREIQNREQKGVLWGDLVGKWIKYLEERNVQAEVTQAGKTLLRKLSGSTFRNYTRCVLDFTDHWMKRPAAEITPADVEALFESMTHAGYASNSQYNVKVAINRCFVFGIKRRLITGVLVSPAHGFGISRKESTRSEILTINQVQKLLSEAKTQNHPWRTIWEGAYHTGGRSGELYELRAKDISLEERRGVFERKFNFQEKVVERQIEPVKDKEWRQFPINDDLKELLLELGVDKMRPDEYIFPRINAWKSGDAAKVLREFCENIEIPSICFHTLRACWATHLLRNGVSHTVVQTMGGWSDLKTMQRYLRLAGVEIDGATDSLSIRKRERPAKVLRLIHSA